MSAEQRLPMASSCLRLPKVHSNPLVREAASEHDGQRLRVVAQGKMGQSLLADLELGCAVHAFGVPGKALSDFSADHFFS
jgi:hypothetical protein